MPHRLAVRMRGRGYGTGIAGAGAGGGLFAPIPGLGNLNDGLYWDTRKGSLVPERGPTFGNVRATASTVVDHEGLVRNILSGEARFAGLRRVQNLIAKSDDLTNAAWVTFGVGASVVDADTLTFGASNSNGYRSDYTVSGGVASRTFVASVVAWVDSGTAKFRLRNTHVGVLDTDTADLTVTTTPQRFSLTVVNGATAGTAQRIALLNESAGGGKSINFRNMMLEEATGQAITHPSEFVSVGVLSTPFHGAGVDGVKYFNTANGNTVASNVVTEAAGAPLDTATLQSGIRPFGASTERLLWNRDFTNAAWVKGATITVAKDQTGVDGVANSASRMTGGAVGSTNTVGQGFVLASSTRYQYAYIKRLVGTGVIEMSTDSGISFVNVTSQISSSWSLVTIPAQTLANPGAVFRIQTNGDSIAVDFASNRSEANAPVIATTTAQVTVNADVITASGAGYINATEGTPYVMAYTGTGTAVDQVFFNLDDGTANERITVFRASTTNVMQVNINDGGSFQAQMPRAAVANSTAFKLAARYKLNDSNVALDGSAGTADTTCTMPTMTTLRVGGYTSAGVEANSTIAVVALARTGASDANLAIATAP